MLSYLLLLVLQIVILVVIACGFHWTFRRRPGVQYFVWLATIVSIGLAIPLQSQVPSLEMKIPVVAEQSPAVTSTELFSEPFETVPDEAAEQEVSADNSAPVPRKSAAVSSASLSSVSTGVNAARLTAWHWLSIVYVAIVLAFTVRLLAGILALHRLANSARPMTCSASIVDAIAVKVCRGRKVRVMVSDRISVPMAFGIIRPTVLLPECFESWTEETQRAVLLHEFSHIQRFDAFWDLVSRLIAAMYWFHPAVHFAIRRLRQTREQATDRLVLQHGVSPSVYATQLLEVASNASRLNRPALYMSCQGDIKNRIESILSCVPAPQKKLWKLKVALLASFLILASVSIRVSFATIGMQEKVPAEVTKKEPTKPEDVTGKTFYERVQQIEPREVKSNGKPISVSGRVVDDEGNPVPGAIVIFRDASVTLANGTRSINDVLAKTTSGRDGSYSFDDFANPIDSRGFSSSQLFCVSEGKIGFNYLIGRSLNSSKPMENIDIKMVDAVSAKGKVVDAAGDPVSGARVGIGYLSEPLNGIQNQIPFDDRLINPESTTDEQGRFELPGLPAGFVAFLNLNHPEYATNFELLRTTDDHPSFVTYRGNEKRDVRDNGATIQLEKGIELTGTVTDQDGDPISDVRVSTAWRNCLTDASGRFSFRAVESNVAPEVDLFVSHGFHRIFRVEQSKLKDGSANLQFLPPGRIKGKVINANSGLPIKDFRVRFDAEDGNSMVREEVSDANGNFETDIESGKIELVLRSLDSSLIIKKAHGEGWEVVERNTQEDSESFGVLNVKSGETSEITIRIPVRGSTRARVLGLDGQPVEGALVGYQSMDGGTVGFSETDADGMAGIDRPVRPVESRLLVAKFEDKGKVFFAELNTKDDPEFEVFELKLRPSITIAGKVTVDSQPLGDVAVFVNRPNGLRPSYVVGSARTNDRGEYSVQVSRGSSDGRLPGYRVTVRSTKIPNERISLAVNKAKLVDGQPRADVDLIRGTGKISGVVVDSAGEPVANAWIEVQDLMTRHPERKELQASQLFESTSTFTDENGKFEFKGLPEGYEAIIVAMPRNVRQGASFVSVGSLTAKVLVRDIGEESKASFNRR